MSSQPSSISKNEKHQPWVKTSHWIITISFLLLVFTGIEILMVHPRLYWGEVGNELTPAFLELPISRNHNRSDWEAEVPFFDTENSPVSAGRNGEEEMFNENGWGRSLHFLSAWFLVVTGLVYVILGLLTGHFQKHIWPRLRELSPVQLFRDIREHIKMKIAPPTGGPQYGVLQKIAYMSIIFISLPMAIITGFTMSPAITAAFPFLLEIFGGYQTARTIHFFTSIGLEIFLVMHIAMIILSGFKQQVRYMTIGKQP
ncbi:cytochrome b/b6 domain-containing protein [Algoriphagus machipongonensis]|uniref:HupC/HyaC/HydC family protein n=1 Tax=Algoriphagus machipongonensis TaxID=388413 RepID=A3HYQ3_9BACT|nr:cytochrome b/b6 domain-containing protein [Algoriphagus machipongonensis]EAZ80389.1 putative HupC/HyaC/HydC family protein [Algoriphagus machipongonensis]